MAAFALMQPASASLLLQCSDALRRPLESSLSASTLSQQKASLWTQTGARVYAVISAAEVPGLLAQLTPQNVAGWDGLHRGALPPDEAEKATYVAELRAESPFTDWLLGDASTALANWGVVVVSTQGLRAVREQLRSLAEAQTPQGQRFALRWFDRPILQALLPSMSPSQLQTFFGDSSAIVLPAANSWTWYRESVGQLVTDVRTLAA